MNADIHLHRFIGGVHLAAILLIGIGLNVIWDIFAVQGKKIAKKIAARLPKARVSAGNSEQTDVQSYRLVSLTLGCLLIGAMLISVWRERAAYLNDNKHMMEATYQAFKNDEGNIQALVDYLKGLQTSAPGRVYAGLPTTWGKKFTVGEVPMYAVLSVEKLDALSYLYHAMSLNADIQVHFDENDPAHYNLFNVGYVVAPKERIFPEFVRPIRTIGNWIVYKVQTSGYFDLVQSDIAFYGTKENWYRANFQWLNSGLLKANQYPSIFFQKDEGPYRQWIQMGDRVVLPKAEDLKHEVSGEIVSERIDNQTYSASVVNRTPSYLLFKMTYHPYWHVLVDNEAKQSVMLSPSFIGVGLEAGEHEVKFQYDPPRYKSVLLILGFITLVGLFFFEKKWITRFARF